MIVLASSTQTLQVVLAGAKTSLDCPVTVMFIDEPATTSGTAVAVRQPQQSTTNGITAVVVCAAPGAGPGFRRRITSIYLNVKDTGAITATFQLVDSATSTTTIIQSYTLQTLEQMNYDEESGWNAKDANGAAKSQASATSSSTSTADSKATSAGTQASTADSKAVSDSVTTSTADSKGTSAGTQASANLSTLVAQSTTTSSAVTSVAGAASVADSKAVSGSLNASTGLSTAGSAGTAASVADSKAVSDSVVISSLTSRVSSKGN